MMGMMPKPPMIQVVMTIGSLLLVPLQIPSGGDFLLVLLSLNVGSQISLQGVRVFDQAVWLTHGTVGQYGRAAAVSLVTKSPVAWVLGCLPPRCENNCN
jgi:hypothetical protein